MITRTVTVTLPNGAQLSQESAGDTRRWQGVGRAFWLGVADALDLDGKPGTVAITPLSQVWHPEAPLNGNVVEAVIGVSRHVTDDGDLPPYTKLKIRVKRYW